MLHQKEGIFELYMWCNCNNETFSLHWFFFKVIMKIVLSVWYDCTILFICFNSNVLLQGKQIDTNSLYFSTLSGSSRILYTLFLFTHMYQVLMNLTLCPTLTWSRGKGANYTPNRLMLQKHGGITRNILDMAESRPYLTFVN